MSKNKTHNRSLQLIPPPNRQSSGHSGNGVAWLLLFSIVLVIYSNSYHCSWHFDDYKVITNNSRLRNVNFDIESIKQVITAHPVTQRLYRPIPMLSFAVNWHFGKESVWGYHLVNNFIHFLTAFVLFLTIRLLFRTPAGESQGLSDSYSVALLTAVLWAAHPIQTQAVTYIVQRMAAMAAMFYILGIYFFLKSRLDSSKNILFSGCCFFCFLAGIFSKENAAIFPISIILIEFIFFDKIKDTLKDFKKRRKTFLFSTIGALVLSGTCVFLFYSELSNFVGKSYIFRPYNLFERLLTEPRVLSFYLSQIFYPTPDRLSIIHPISFSKSLLDPITTILSIFFILSLIFYSIYKYNQRPFLAFGILFFFINHIIESSIIGLELVYEHRNYLPTLFLFLPVSIFFIKQIKNYYTTNRVVYSLILTSGTCIIFVLGLSTYTKNVDWASEKALWENVLRNYPKSTRALHNLAYGHYSKKGDYNTALQLYAKALSLDWTDNSATYRKGITLNNVAGIYYGAGKDEQAIRWWNKAIDVYPSYVKAILGRTQAYISLGRWDEALRSLDGIPERRQLAQSLNMKAFIWLKKGNYDMALSASRQALSMSPFNYKSLVYISAIYSKLGNYKKSRFFLSLAALKKEDSKTILMLLENAILLNDYQLSEKYLSMVLKPEIKNEVLSSLRASKRNESIPLALDLIIPLISSKTNNDTRKWILSIEELINDKINF